MNSFCNMCNSFQLEEQKRRQKIEMWDSMQEGKSYKGTARKPPEEDNPGPSTSSVLPKRKSDRKPLRGGGEYQTLKYSEQLQGRFTF